MKAMCVFVLKKKGGVSLFFIFQNQCYVFFVPNSNGNVKLKLFEVMLYIK